MAFFTRAPLLCMAFFALAPLLCALPENEMQITLYMDMAWGGANKSEAVVVQGSNDRFGETRVNNWLLLDGPDPSSAKIMGRAHGSHINSQPDIDQRLWAMFVHFVFSDERYGGSTLQISGLIPTKSSVGEWSVVGGTGELTMARGVAKYEIVKRTGDYNLYKVNIHVYYSSVDSTTVYAE